MPAFLLSTYTLRNSWQPQSDFTPEGQLPTIPCGSTRVTFPVGQRPSIHMQAGTSASVEGLEVTLHLTLDSRG